MKNLQNKRQSSKRESKNQVPTVFLEVVSENKTPIQISLEGSERRGNLNTQFKYTDGHSNTRTYRNSLQVQDLKNYCSTNGELEWGSWEEWEECREGELVC